MIFHFIYIRLGVTRCQLRRMREWGVEDTGKSRIFVWDYILYFYLVLKTQKYMTFVTSQLRLCISHRLSKYRFSPVFHMFNKIWYWKVFIISGVLGLNQKSDWLKDLYWALEHNYQVSRLHLKDDRFWMLIFGELRFKFARAM